MKKILFVLIGLVISLNSYAKILNPEVKGNIISILFGKDTYHTRVLTIHIDNNGKYYLGVATKASFYTSDEFWDNSFLNNFEYSVNPQKHIYLKLDNDSIITLTCEKLLFEELKWEWGDNYKYKIFSGNVISIFRLNNTNIELLRTHNIIKIRFEERLIWDISEETALAITEKITSKMFEYLLNNSYQIYNNYLQKKEQKEKEYQEQQLLKQDPLYNF